MAVHPQFDGERAYALASLYVPLTDLQRYAYLCYEAADEYFEAEMAPFSVFRRRRRRQAYNKWDVAYQSLGEQYCQCIESINNVCELLESSPELDDLWFDADMVERQSIQIMRSIPLL